MGRKLFIIPIFSDAPEITIIIIFLIVLGCLGRIFWHVCAEECSRQSNDGREYIDSEDENDYAERGIRLQTPEGGTNLDRNNKVDNSKSPEEIV